MKGTGKNGKEEEDCCIDHKTSNTGVALVCDIDGVLLHGSSLIPGADTVTFLITVEKKVETEWCW